jgi:predicted nucleic acid-binding protein
MSVEQVFVDTNILVYAHDVDAGERHDRARLRLSELWERKAPPAISVQVLQELYTTLIKKEVPQSRAEEVVGLYLRWKVIDNTVLLLMQGMEEQKRWQVSPWDAWILAAARQAGARQLWSEDFSAGQDYDGLVVINPLMG